MTTSSHNCPVCGAPVSPRSRFCPSCGCELQPPATATNLPEEVMLPNAQQVRIEGETLQLRDLINVVESSVRWWKENLHNADAVTRARAAQAISDLSRILHSLSQQLALGRETIRITKRLPVQRRFLVGCPVCGHGNRPEARFCQHCGAALASVAQERTKADMRLRLRIGMRTDTGRVRRHNEDSVYFGELPLPKHAPAYLCLVADGMGGARAGEQASRIASEVTQDQLRRDVNQRKPLPPDDSAWQQRLQRAIHTANKRVYEAAHDNAEQRGMGTTLTVALIVGDHVHIASVGDSRAYLINAGGLAPNGATAVQLTSDHSLVARLVDIGQITEEEARTHPQRNILYRSIGTDPSVEVDTFSEQVRPSDSILLCSDGLINYVRDDELARIALDHADPEMACARLVALANDRGGSDNISVLIVRIEGDG